uniref:Uncharacterized protein n=1 Tax=Oryza sativa subsp. japonica TaxID=39947 RepID=Q75IH7_ORYSJ|nr:hypothetical protein [Oryza sativa Japonica Group]
MLYVATLAKHFVYELEGYLHQVSLSLPLIALDHQCMKLVEACCGAIPPNPSLCKINNQICRETTNPTNK